MSREAAQRNEAQVDSLGKAGRRRRTSSRRIARSAIAGLRAAHVQDALNRKRGRTLREWQKHGGKLGHVLHTLPEAALQAARNDPGQLSGDLGSELPNWIWRFS
jgi:hypothetical protein